MLHSRELRTCFITFILLLSSLSIIAITPDVAKAQDISDSTTLYFHDFLASAEVNQNPPIKENDSAWPPSITDTEDWLVWFLIWLESKIDFGEEWGYDDPFFDLALFLNPLNIIEEYFYDGEEELEISGNIVFDLYFSSTLSSKILKDEVKVGIYNSYLKELYNSTSKITSKLTTDKVYKTEITMEGVDITLEPGESIFFTVEIIPSKKPISTLIEFQNEEELFDIAEEIALLLSNQSYIPELQDIGLLIMEVLNASGTEEFNFTLADIADLANIAASSSFIYDSIDHPSSVILPIGIEGENENIKKYFLHDEQIMDENPSEEEKELKIDIKEIAEWVGPIFERSKILKEAKASLYLDHHDLLRFSNLLKDKIKINAALVLNENIIATTEETLDRTTILALFQKPDEPTVFTFSNLSDPEIKYDESINLRVAVSNDTQFGLLKIRRDVKLLYGSVDFPSSLLLIMEDTDHIEIVDIVKNPDNEKTVPGGSVEYILNITSKLENEEIDIIKYDFSSDEEELWDIDIEPESIQIPKGAKKTVKIIVTSTYVDVDAYGEKIDVTFAAAGKTGRDTFESIIEISEDAIDFNIEINDPEDKGIKHGTSDTYTFKIKNINTGLWEDSYTIEAKSENNWQINLSDDEIEDLDVGEEAEIIVTIHVPEDTEISTDELTFTVTSQESISHGKEKIITIKVTTQVIGPNILEMFYGFFEDAADALGLDEVMGSYGAAFLAAIVFIIIFFIIILLVYLLTIKYVNIICLDRIKEITTDEKAHYEIAIHNPYKYPLNYKINMVKNSQASNWETELDTDTIMLDSKQSKTILLTVKPTDYVKANDWAETKIIVTALEKNKKSELSTVTTIKDAKPDLKIVGVLNWPTVFKKGDRVVTSFKIRNSGNAAANKVDVILYINGKEKNKVEGIIIPSGGYADVEIPWIAVKGKNEINIIVK